MHILKAFIPWIIFTILTRNNLPIKGSIIALVIYAYLYLSRSYTLKLLDVCSIVFFGGAIVAIEFIQFNWFTDHIMYIADAFLAGVILLTIFIKKPFTLAYAKEITSPDKWQTKEFLQINMIISLIWFFYFSCSTLIMPLFQNYYSEYMLLHILALILAIILTKITPKWYFKIYNNAKSIK